MAFRYFISDIVINELRALMITRFCGYERNNVHIRYDLLCHSYEISIESLVTNLKRRMRFDADNINDDKFRRTGYLQQLNLNWSDPVC